MLLIKNQISKNKLEINVNEISKISKVYLAREY